MKKKHFLISFILLTFFFTTSCKTTTKVVNIKDAEKYQNGNLVYTLPQTMVRVKVDVTKTTVRRGPFYAFATKYLGLTNVPAADKTTYHISGLEISSYNVPDTNQIFLAKIDENSAQHFASLANNGHILSYYLLENLGAETLTNTNFFAPVHDNPSVIYTDLTVKTYISDVVQAVEERVITEDTAFIMVTEYTKNQRLKTADEKAREAANFIIKLRNRQFKLLAGVADKVNFPDAASVEYMNAELNKLEDEYVALFTGKVFTDTTTYYFDMLPQNDSEVKKTLFYFSEETGISLSSYGGNPITVEVTKMGTTRLLEQYFEKNTEKVKKGIVYRIPDDAIIKLMNRNTELAVKKLSISQFGALIIMPSVKNK